MLRGKTVFEWKNNTVQQLLKSRFEFGGGFQGIFSDVQL